MKYQILNGDNIKILKTLESNSIDAVITDPPYGIDFLGKAWDANTGALETYQECLRVLKPGGHILAFSAARTYHHLAITLEQAGFEIRDQIMWIYSSGFPKSQDVGKSIDRSKNKGTFVKTGKTKVSGGPKENPNGPLPRTDETIYYPETDEAKQWAGWGTSLKPAHEPICMARKPMKLSIAKNAQRWGTGALNIDATRVPIDDQLKQWYAKYPEQKSKDGVFENYNPELQDKLKVKNTQPIDTTEVQGRFPSNVIGEIAEPYQKYFYCPKVSRKERHAGFDPNSQGVIIDSEVFGKTPVCLDCGKTRNGSTKHTNCDPNNITFEERRTKRSAEVGNNHPTVKPVELMKYLIKLVTPPNGKVLDPFNGSGSTGMAAVELGHEYIGIEQDESYCEISRRRIAAHFKKSDPLRASGLFD